MTQVFLQAADNMNRRSTPKG